MCYDIQAQLETQLKRAKRDADEHAIYEIKTKLERLTDHPYHHVSGFKHPKVIIYTNEDPFEPTISQWGLAPYWAKDRKQLYSAWNKTLNARGETIFELKSFKSSAINRRCIIPVDGFYEHRHYKGKTYPHYIYRKDGKPMNLAGLWREWKDKVSGDILNTFSIVTTTANPMMEKIHNNPAASEEPRMPVILLDELEEKWLQNYEEELAEQAVSELIQPFPEENMDFHTVDRLRGKEYKGNVPEIDEEVEYPELSQQELF